jgi:hypothetical protein
MTLGLTRRSGVRSAQRRHCAKHRDTVNHSSDSATPSDSIANSNCVELHASFPGRAYPCFGFFRQVPKVRVAGHRVDPGVGNAHQRVAKVSAPKPTALKEQQPDCVLLPSFDCVPSGRLISFATGEDKGKCPRQCPESRVYRLRRGPPLELRGGSPCPYRRYAPSRRPRDSHSPK